jgi:hypothetical protein
VRASVTQEMTMQRLPTGQSLLHVVVHFTNIGQVLIRLSNADFRIEQILPVKSELGRKLPTVPGHCQISWPIIGEWQPNWRESNCVVESGETHDVCCDHLLGRDVRVVQVYSFFQNPQHTDPMGWSVSKICEIGGDDMSRGFGSLWLHQHGASTSHSAAATAPTAAVANISTAPARAAGGAGLSRGRELPAELTR